MSFTVLHRFLVRPETVESVRRLCEPTEDFCWVNHSGSREQRLRRHTLRGVPARVIDLVLPEHSEDAPIAVEIGGKTGKYDDPAAAGYSPRRQERHPLADRTAVREENHSAPARPGEDARRERRLSHADPSSTGAAGRT